MFGIFLLPLRTFGQLQHITPEHLAKLTADTLRNPKHQKPTVFYLNKAKNWHTSFLLKAKIWHTSLYVTLPHISKRTHLVIT